MLKYVAASELGELSETERAKRCNKKHNKWLTAIQQGISNATNNGFTYYYVECSNLDDVRELRDIYEPLGCIVVALCSYYDDPVAVIHW